MYAVIRTGGKQYRVAPNDVISVEKLPGDAGETIDLDDVLMLGEGAEATIGTPLVDGARVEATILEQTRGAKIIVFKKQRRKGHRRKKGHRQDLTVLRITDIHRAGAKVPKKTAAPEAAATPAAAAPAAEAEAEAEAAPKKAAAKKAAAEKPAAKKASKPKADDSEETS